MKLYNINIWNYYRFIYTLLLSIVKWFYFSSSKKFCCWWAIFKPGNWLVLIPKWGTYTVACCIIHSGIIRIRIHLVILIRWCWTSRWYRILITAITEVCWILPIRKNSPINCRAGNVVIQIWSGKLIITPWISRPVCPIRITTRKPIAIFSLRSQMVFQPNMFSTEAIMDWVASVC